MMSRSTRNRWVWLGSLLVGLALWGIAARWRLHLVDELAFIGCVALAAAILTGLYWWDVCADDDPPESAPHESAPHESEKP